MLGPAICPVMSHSLLLSLLPLSLLVLPVGDGTLGAPALGWCIRRVRLRPVRTLEGSMTECAYENMDECC